MIAAITLLIDTDTYRREAGEDLTAERLLTIAQDVNADAAPILGYESWICGFIDANGDLQEVEAADLQPLPAYRRENGQFH